ncbi:MAG: serine hydrolase [Campylobacterota bacterium]|nr:serine hydrolase [Campylobacterota bacterium]
MRERVLILHGWGGSDFPHWQSRLASEVAKEYGCVSFLKFSNFDFPQKDVWMQELLQEMQEFKPTVVVCHSLANILWFHLCNDAKIASVKKLFLVAPPSLSCDIVELKSFYPCKVPDALNAKNALLVVSTNDPYMSLDEAKELQKSLNVPIKIIENGGHINTASGFGEWKWIFEAIKEPQLS